MFIWFDRFRLSNEKSTQQPTIIIIDDDSKDDRILKFIAFYLNRKCNNDKVYTTWILGEFSSNTAVINLDQMWTIITFGLPQSFLN